GLRPRRPAAPGPGLPGAAHSGHRHGLAFQDHPPAPALTYPARGHSGRAWRPARAAGSAAALAAERTPVPGPAVSAVDLPGFLAPARVRSACLFGALAFQCLAELASRLVLGIRLVAGSRLAPGTRLALRTRFAFGTRFACGA